MSIYGKPIMLGGSGGISIAYESIDQWQIKTLNGLSKTYNLAKNSNNNIQVVKLDDSLMYHISGTFSNGNAVRAKWTISKSDAEYFAGKYLNFKMEGTYSGRYLISGNIQANVEPWTNQAAVTPTSRKQQVASFPSGSYSEVTLGIDVGWEAQAGDTIDAYIELTFTDD